MYHRTGGDPRAMRVTRRLGAVTTVFYEPGAGGSSIVPGATAVPSSPIVFRPPVIPGVTSPVLEIQPAPVQQILPPAVVNPNLPGAGGPLTTSLTDLFATAQPAPPSSAPESSGPPPAMSGPVSNPDGSPAGGIGLGTIALIAAALYVITR